MRRFAIGIAAAVIAAGCAQRVTPHVAKSSPRVGVPTAASPSEEGAGAPPAPSFRQPIALPGCNDEGVASLRKRIEDIDRRVSARTVDDVDAITSDIVAAWRHPCLGHLARVFPPPSKISATALQDLWQRGLRGTLMSMAGALYVRDGKRYFIVPPTEADPVTLTPSRRTELSPWLCPDGDTRCGRAPAFTARAEGVFDREEQLALRWHGIIVGPQNADAMPNSFLSSDDNCRPRAPSEDEPETMTLFEQFTVCAATVSPKTWRYPRDIKLQARESGWLVLRGRRGHYSFSDEVRAYDLKTGAAYVARSESALVLGATTVDFAAVEKKRALQTTTGTVSAEQVRELAFMLATGSLVRASRSEVQLVPVPEDLAITFTKGHGFDVPFVVPESKWGSSAHTSIAWTLVENGATIAEGEVMWPSSWRASDSHADELLRVVEAGLASGCAPARLPTGIVRGAHGKITPIDADPAAQVDVFADLAKRLEGLGDRVCR